MEVFDEKHSPIQMDFDANNKSDLRQVTIDPASVGAVKGQLKLQGFDNDKGRAFVQGKLINATNESSTPRSALDEVEAQVAQESPVPGFAPHFFPGLVVTGSTEAPKDMLGTFGYNTTEVVIATHVRTRAHSVALHRS